VLGVGDARFNQKATAAMTDKIHSEQTVVLVSHSMPQVRQLCDRVLWLDQGKLRMIGETADVLGQYQEFVS